MTDVLIINSYAGSLTVGVNDAELPIRASYEDSGFGIAAQKKNFPELKFIDHAPWPADDLSKTIVISHPPCAAFSNQNSSKAKKGVNTDAFQCHRNVMKYAFENRCAALAIESVPGVIAAWQEYASAAERHDYDFVIIELNAASFDVPQWRPRLWTLFFRRELGLKHFNAWLYPKFKSIGDIVDIEYQGEDFPDWIPGGDKHSGPGRLVQGLIKRARTQIENYDEFAKSDNVGRFQKAYAEWSGKQMPDWAAVRSIAGPGWFSTMLPNKLALNGLAPVLMHQSFWYVNGRPMSIKEYQRVMGFPDSWQWPEKMHPEFRLYLSKGVCPPVAAWIAKQMSKNIMLMNTEVTATHSCAWGKVLNIEPKKTEVLDHLAGRIAGPGLSPGCTQWYIRDLVATPVIDNDVIIPPDSIDHCLTCGKEIPPGPDFCSDVCATSTRAFDQPDGACGVVDHDYHAHTNDADKVLWNSLKPKPYLAAQIMFDRRPEDKAIFKYDAETRTMKFVAAMPNDIALVRNTALLICAPPRELREKPVRMSDLHHAVDRVFPPAGTTIGSHDYPSSTVSKRTINRASKEELEARRTQRYALASGIASDQWEPGAHAWAIVKALESVSVPIQRSNITQIIQEQSLIKTTMKLEAAINWMLNELVKKGKVLVA